MASTSGDGALHGEIINLNVGGRYYSTSRETLTWPSVKTGSFFVTLLSGRLPSQLDSNGAYFIDRDPDCFNVILEFLRTRTVNLRGLPPATVLREAEYFGIWPLIQRLRLCHPLRNKCGDLLFTSFLHPPQRNEWSPDNPVLLIAAHQDCLAIAYTDIVYCYRSSHDGITGWKLIFTSRVLSSTPTKIALRCNHETSVSLAVAAAEQVIIWTLDGDDCMSPRETSDSCVTDIRDLFFAASQLVAICNDCLTLVIWHAASRAWRCKKFDKPLCSWTNLFAVLYAGREDGMIVSLNTDSLPTRIQDDSLLMTPFFQDPNKCPITSLCCYTAVDCLELAYGTAAGHVCILVNNQTEVPSVPFLFAAFQVHRHHVDRVALSKHFLIAVCAGDNHVRTWRLTRFRGLLPMQPPCTPLASYRMLSIVPSHPLPSYPNGNYCGPYTITSCNQLHDMELIMVYKLAPDVNSLTILNASSGNRLCQILSIDSSSISAFTAYVKERPGKVDIRPSQFVVTGHSNGSIQFWDLTTAMEITTTASEQEVTLLSPNEILDALEPCELADVIIPQSDYSNSIITDAVPLTSVVTQCEENL